MASNRDPLSVTHPDLAAQADGWDPTQFTSGSERKLTWRCSQEHVWETTIASRVLGSSCPICSGRSVLAGFNDLATTRPDLAHEAHNWDPTAVTSKSKKKLSWQCAHGHVWDAEVRSRSVIGAGCPFCDGRRAVPGMNDLATLHPQVAEQAYGWDPSVVNPHSHKKLEFICSEGHVFVQSVRRRVEATGCPICQNDRVVIGFNDLATTHPELAAQANGWDPRTVSAGTHKKSQWKCSQRHIWTTGIINRAKDGTGCPYCSGRIAIPGETDLATTHPQLAAEAVGWDPTTVKAGTGKKLKWRCPSGHEWLSAPSTRSGQNTGCPYCSGYKVIPGETDLATTHPELAAEAVGWDPTTVGRGNQVKRRWRCYKHHEWDAPVYSRASGGNGCPYCSGHKVIPGETDLATTHPELAAEAVGWDPTTVGFGSSKKVLWFCPNGHKYRTRISHRTYMKSNCPTCAQSGFDPNMDGWLYLIDHDELKMFQVGISNFPQQRLERHAKRGWEVLEVRGPMKGHLAQQLETAILHSLERRGAILGHKAQIDKFDGYSEAWTKDSLNVTDLKQLLEWVYDDEEQPKNE
jgi:hypothetical protein